MIQSDSSRISRSLWQLLVLALTIGVTFVHASEFELDPSFSSDGKATVPFDQGGTNRDTLVKMLWYPNSPKGSYVMVGSVALANGGVAIGLSRIKADGTLDSSFGVGGKVIKDACMTKVTNAILDSNYRIVVVGQTNCSGNATLDAAVIRFNVDGSDDTAFAGDGGINFKFLPDFDGEDEAGAVVALADGSYIVGGSYVVGAGVRSPKLKKISSTGVDLGILGQGLVATSARTIVDGLSVGAQSFWLISEPGDTSVPGAIKKINNGDLSQVAGFGEVSGEKFVSRNGACPMEARELKSFAVFGDTLKIFGVMQSAAQKPSSLSSMRLSDGSMYSDLCFDLKLDPDGVFDAGFLATTVEVEHGAVFSDDKTVVVGGMCSVPASFCVSRFRKASTGFDQIELDPTFNSTKVVAIQFDTAAGQTPSSAAFDLELRAGQIIAAGNRRWDGADTDFAIARFGTDIFRNGFENP